MVENNKISFSNSKKVYLNIVGAHNITILVFVYLDRLLSRRFLANPTIFFFQNKIVTNSKCNKVQIKNCKTKHILWGVVCVKNYLKFVNLINGRPKTRADTKNCPDESLRTTPGCWEISSVTKNCINHCLRGQGKMVSDFW